MENPWQVHSIEAFAYLKCPECEFDSKAESSFKNHALKTHPLSQVFFGKAAIDNDTKVAILKYDRNDTQDYIQENYKELQLGSKKLLGINTVKDEMVQFLYSGEVYCKNQKEANILSENLTGLFGFPKLCLSSKIEPKFEIVSKSISKEEFFNMTNSSNRKKSRKQSLTSASIRNEFIDNLVSIKTESKDLFDETNLNEENLSDPLDTNKKGEDDESDTICKVACTVCSMKFVTKQALAAHVFLKHSNACNVCLKQFESKQHLEDHISTAHTLPDFRKRLRCVICNILFKRRNKDKSTLTKHMKSEHKVGYKCPICQMQQPSLSTLNQHKIQEHNLAVKIIKHRDACTICFRQFESKKDMEAHISKDHPWSDFRNVATRCVICDLSYGKDKESFKKFKEHMVSEHNVGYECPICQKKLPTVSKLIQHKIQEHNWTKSNSVGRIKYLCPKCGKEFIHKRKYEHHVSKISCNQSKGRKCPICEEEFESMSLKIYHISTKHMDVKLYDCSECSSGFITQNGLKRHISCVHRKNVGNICPTCGKTYYSISHLKDHISYVHEGKVKPRFKCSMCEESYSTKKYLENHMPVHEGNGIFQCSNCNMEFNSKNKLEAHIAKEHDRSKLHKCVHCDSGYLTKTALSSHIAFVHEKTIGNICPHCGRNCMKQADLKNHIRRVHELEGKYIFKCEHCEKSFKLESTLKSHIKIIHEGTRVKCPVCQKPFVTKKSMKRHIENVHEKKKPYMCDICNERFAQSGHLVTHKKGKHKISM